LTDTIQNRILFSELSSRSLIPTYFIESSFRTRGNEYGKGGPFLIKSIQNYRFGTVVPFLALHLASLGVLLNPFRWQYCALLAATFVVRIFGVTAGYHRYFSHRAYKLNRFFQFLLAALAHGWGTRRFATADGSRNNILLALITLGEGWHNNHHRFMYTCRQGILSWEVDFTYSALRLLNSLGVARDLRGARLSAIEPEVHA
jgi:fatty-acid desaturase